MNTEGTPLLLAENLVLSLPPLPPLRIPRLVVPSAGFVVILAGVRDLPPILEQALWQTLVGERRAEVGRVLYLGEELAQADPGWAAAHGLSLGVEAGVDGASSVEANLLRSTGGALPTWLFRFLPLQERLPVPADLLSPVERRWLVLARALALRPRLLLLRRPLDAFPPLPRQSLLERLIRINLEEGIAFCFTAAPSALIETAAAGAYRIVSGLLVAA
ncbi:hypothetical protein [Methylacidimicrobium sp. B4]|uniref:hypothetical protein n=1 Tax=Methylacidimicrobium sp. B4 TaxID=2796139 RepID=UPI001A8E1D8E|nr:hypothetical protein [Methylacidimicrobium sp. B4]QSR83852.1 hypothetical protein MacB4_06080 [Methylacidimicrobium sp. B4]